MIVTFLLSLLKTQCIDFKPNTTFDICYINLARENARNEHIQKLLDTAKCTFSRIDAVDGVALFNGTKSLEDYTSPYDLKINVKLENFKWLASNLYGMAGCKLSHYINLRRIEKTQSEKPVLILEDDADLEVDFVNRVEMALETAPKDWDIIMVTDHCTPDERNTYNNSDHVIKLKGVCESLFLINGANSARRVADLLEYVCLPSMAIDTFFGYQSQEKRVNIYGLKENISIQMRQQFASAIPTSWMMYSKPLKNSLSDFLKEQLNN